MPTPIIVNIGGSAIRIETGPGVALTPASHVCLDAVVAERHRLGGMGIDWGTGTGCLAVALALLPDVERVVAIELDEDARAVAEANVARNGVAHVVDVVAADLFEAFDGPGRRLLESLVGNVDFLVANPPASSGDDGLGWRRRVLAGGRRYLKRGAPVLVQISSQYGEPRVWRLPAEVPGYRYDGLAASSEWVAFELDRPDLMDALETYVAEEERGGLPYAFRQADSDASSTAAAAAAHHRRTGRSPRSRWQVHRFVYDGT